MRVEREPAGAITESCMISNFQKFATLDHNEQALLSGLEKDPRKYNAGQPLVCSSGDSDRFFILKSGWACSTRTLADGQRQVLDIFLPGQILGLREISFNRNLSEFRALTLVVACPFPRRRLTEIFQKAPRLMDLFFRLQAREQAMLIERVINIGRRSAAERLAHFLVEMKVRLNQPADEFELPINQAVIADALSLSSVHVCRTFKYLRDNGLVEKSDGCIRIRNLGALIELAGFDCAYLEADSNWAGELH